MFYSQFILAKKGPLGTIWIAAHLERKLRKNQVADTDIGVSVDSILFPEMPIALRLSSHLLLGVVRIYSRKVNYLFDDCSEALLKVKQAFRSTAVDLPPEESTAPYHSITLPETFDLDDFELPDSEIFQGNYVDHHISSKDQITLQDTMDGVVFSTSKFGLDERFGDGDDASGLDLDEELMVEKAATAEHVTGTSNSDVDPQASGHANAGIVNQQMEEYDGDNEPVDYAQAPCTPGLWEEPNLSNIQETSACDDHQEQENHTIPEFSVKENLENASSNEIHEQQQNQFKAQEQQQNQFQAQEQQQNQFQAQEQQQNQFETIEKSLPQIVETEQLLMNDVGSTSTPFTESVLADHVRSMSEAVIPVSDDPAKVQGLPNNNFRDGPPGFQTLDLNHENCVEYQDNQENARHVTTELEPNTEFSNKNNVFGSPQDQVYMQHKDSGISVQSSHESIQNSDLSTLRPGVTFQNHETNEGPLATEAYREHNDSSISIQPPHENMPNSGFPTLRPCVNFQNHEINGQGPHVTEPFQKNFPEIHPAEYFQNNEVQVASSMSNRQVENPLENVVQVNNINSYTSDYPAPEKLLSLPQGLPDIPKYFVPENTPTETDITISGKKRSFTESSLTAQTLNLNEASGLNLNYSSGQNLNFSSDLNLNESSGFFTTSMTTGQQSVMNDDDLLSSILVGRKSSILKMKPTPPVQPPTKRQRRSSAPKTGILKRKVVMDDNMVLHGDTIRQQLTNTEDIRRLRKKAPCTRAEISMLEKQFWEDEIFTEPILTGLSIKLASLHNQSFDLRKIVVLGDLVENETDPKSITNNDEIDMQPTVGSNVSKEIGIEDNFDPVAIKNVSETQPIEFNHTFDNNNSTNLDYFGGQTPIHETGNVTEPFGSEHDILRQETAMEIDPKSFPASDIGVPIMPTEVENLIHDNVVPHDMSAALGELENSSQMDASLQTDVPGVHPSDVSATLGELESTNQMDAPDFNQNEKTDLQSLEMDNIESNIVSEIKDDVAPVTEILEEKRDQDIEFSKNEENVVNDDVAFDQNVESNAQNLVYNGIFGEDYATIGAYDTDINPVMENVSLDERENPGHQDNFPMNEEDIPANNRVDDDEFTHSAVDHDTDFLNFDDVDDDDEAEAGGDYAPDVQATRVIDNSGWSSRTKAVAKYLQIMFDKEGERGRNMLPVNNLLIGKTRKEASRMFFETLVLKTKDYIHVEQADPYENINVFPRAKLLKSDF